MAKHAVILGAGFAGCTISHLLVREGWRTTVLEKEQYIGGGCRTFFYGGHPYMNGPRLYYGYSEKVLKWINSFVELRDLPFELLSYVEPEKRFFNYPIFADQIPEMSQYEQIRKELDGVDLEYKPEDFEDYWVSRVGPTLYNMFVNKYSKKMWMIDSNKELDTFSWSAKDSPINQGPSKEAYKGSFLAYPKAVDGYNGYFDKTIQGADLRLGHNLENFDLDNKTVYLADGTKISGDVVISTIPIEELCNHSKGDLPYAGRKFIPFVLPTKEIFPGNVRFCHYTQDEPYTRIVEYKKLTGYESDDTLLVMELPADEGKLYPYMIKKYIDRAKDYRESLPDDVISTGRLGSYRYSTIEQTISQAFSVFKKITGKSVEGIDEEFFQIGDVKMIQDRKTGKPSDLLSDKSVVNT